MDPKLTGKLALVSGSTAGIGFAIVTPLAAEGARVIINGRTEARASEAVAKIRVQVSGAKLEFFAGDLATSEAAQEPLFAQYVVSTIGRRNRLRVNGYDPTVDSVNDAFQSIRLVRSHAAE